MIGNFLLVVCILFVLGRSGRRVLMYVLKKKHAHRHARNLRFLHVKMPRTDSDKDKSNDLIQTMKQNTEVMTQVYKNFYSIYSTSFRDRRFGEPSISCELIVERELIKFVLGVPEDYIETFEKVISSFYPGAVIDEVPQPSFLEAGKFMAGGYFTLTKDAVFPLKTYETFEADPMDSILAGFARVGVDEKLALQIIVSPLTEKRQTAMRKKVEAIKEGKASGIRGFIKSVIADLFTAKDDKKSEENKHGYSSGQISDIEKKADDEGFTVMIRGVAISPDASRPSKMMNDLQRSLNQYNYIGLNSIQYTQESNTDVFARGLVLRLFGKPTMKRKEILFPKKPQILNIKELASIFHFPHNRYNKNPRLMRQKFKIAPAPDNLSTEGILLGYNLYGGVKRDIRLGFNDRFRHMYVIGQTGTGKSTILRTMIHQDIAQGNGFTLIDPHGDLAESILYYFPKERIEDLIYRDAGNDELPLGFNFLIANTDKEMDLVTNDATEMFIQLYGSEIFGPRIQDYFRNGVLTLMEQPDGGTLVEIVRLFTDPAFQKVKVANVKNPVVRARREKTFAGMGDREKQEMIPFFQSKFGPFTTTPTLRNIIGQTDSSFDISQVMDSGKVLIMNLAKGKMGDINASLLGMMIVSQIRLAAFRRADIPEKQRKPHFLYIDEFQNFVTPSIESILSEARKYRLGLILAHQYLGQLEREGTSMKGAVRLRDPIFGNIGNMMAYRIGIDDIEPLEKQFSPTFSGNDLINLDKFKAVIKLSVDMQPTPPFSITVKLPREDPELNTDEKVQIIKQISALKYGRKKELVEKEIFYRVGA